MKISVLQPNIVRGDVEYNVDVINKLLQESEGDLNILAEYALTGSLVLDRQADPWSWAEKCKNAIKAVIIPSGKSLLLNCLKNDNGKLYNESLFLPAGEAQRKCFLDSTEAEAGINPGRSFPLFSFNNQNFKVIICTDLRNAEKIPTDGANFILFIFHFTKNNEKEVMTKVKELSIARKLPIIIASLCSDKNCGHSSYVNGNTVVSLGNGQGILEISI